MVDSNIPDLTQKIPRHRANIPQKIPGIRFPNAGIYDAETRRR